MYHSSRYLGCNQIVCPKEAWRKAAVASQQLGQLQQEQSANGQLFSGTYLKQQLGWWSPAQAYKGLHTGMSSQRTIFSNSQACRGKVAAADQSWHVFVCHSPQPLHLAHHDSQHLCYLQNSSATFSTYCLRVYPLGMILMLAAWASYIDLAVNTPDRQAQV